MSIVIRTLFRISKYRQIENSLKWIQTYWELSTWDIIPTYSILHTTNTYLICYLLYTSYLNWTAYQIFHRIRSLIFPFFQSYLIQDTFKLNLFHWNWMNSRTERVTKVENCKPVKIQEFKLERTDCKKHWKFHAQRIVCILVYTFEKYEMKCQDISRLEFHHQLLWRFTLLNYSPLCFKFG